VSIENARLYREAITDGLTQLYDHNYIAKRLADELEKARRCKRPLSLLMMDIDHFKQFNDMYGHQLGDVVLKAVAGIIMSSARRGIDVPARYGGEEFALIVPQFWSESPTVQKDHRQDTLAIAERIREHVAARKIAQGDKEIGITISIGVAFFDGFSDGLSSHDVIEQADKALYRAKMEGRNRVCIYAADTQEKSN
ncbi:MAG: GGDEF domain-containing protein, partial [Candidatus Aureabacteria bacterium]|nr:GGDEF domain-containing protein [Candidatus Auribacterota bacterium]